MDPGLNYVCFLAKRWNDQCSPVSFLLLFLQQKLVISAVKADMIHNSNKLLFKFVQLSLTVSLLTHK